MTQQEKSTALRQTAALDALSRAEWRGTVSAARVGQLAWKPTTLTKIEARNTLRQLEELGAVESEHDEVDDLTVWYLLPLGRQMLAIAKAAAEA
jgi:DNA-binding MarR family transcriptional regulator